VTYRKDGSDGTDLDLRERGQVDVAYSQQGAGRMDLDLVGLRRSIGDLTQVEAARLLNVTANTWARWERGSLQLHPARAHQLRRLHQLVCQYGDGPFWGLGIDGVRSVIDGLSVPEALDAHGLDRYGAPLLR
jgi:Helix-turn-helix domain